jgi:hypothetical protein
VVLEEFGRKQRKQALQGEWKEIDCVYRDPADASGKMTVFRGGKKRLLELEGKKLAAIRILFEDYAGLVHRVESEDLDRDGDREWYLELAFVYGDGVYSLLLRVDGRGRVDAEPLSHTSGEPGSEEIVAGWGIRAGRLWIVKAGEKRTFAQKLGGKPEAAWLVASEESAALSVPYRKGEAVVWIRALPFAEEGAAKEAASKRQGAGVLRVQP